MILPFKEQFVAKIINGTKVMTIRADKTNRWKVGKKIHFATGVRTNKYNQFLEGRCYLTTRIRIKWYEYNANFEDQLFMFKIENRFVRVCVNNWSLNKTEIETLSIEDGFDTIEDFFKWFNKDFEGKCIYWHRLKTPTINSK